MSGEPNYLTLRDAAYWQSRSRHKSRPGPRPTLGDLQRSTPWVWLWCERYVNPPKIPETIGRAASGTGHLTFQKASC
jgi:hypothetical protein